MSDNLFCVYSFILFHSLFFQVWGAKEVIKGLQLNNASELNIF